ncbi:MAG TPA: DUF4349 domain-containing protein [Anaerolineales bacterium]|nr:DUF4349 domain-containing protein [Anaerolineales bacterium]
MLKKILPGILIIVILLAGCAQASPPSDSRGFAPEAPPVEAPAAVEPAPAGEGSFDQAANNAERLVIKNAYLQIVVDHPDESMNQLSRMAEEMDGYVVSANLTKNVLANGAEVPSASITLRVPAERLDEALVRIEAESDRLPLNKNLTSQDVTSEYTDLQSRLRNLEAAEKQLTQILENANRTEDVLSVYSQLTQVREQIEVIKGQIIYYERSAALSSITVDLVANEAVQPIKIGGWEPVGVAKSAIEALVAALQVLANVAIWLVVFLLPILVIIILPIYLVVRLLLRGRARRKMKAAAPPNTAPPAG